MPNDLRIQIIVDGSQVSAGMGNVTASVDAATARIKAAFGSIEKAPEGIQNALMILQTSARQSAQAVEMATATIAELGSTASAAAPQVQNLGNQSENAAAKMTSMERAMALATGRMAGMAAGAGMLGGALGRVGAASSVLGPMLAAAFPVIAIAAFVDIVAMAYEKLIDFTSGLAGWDKEAQKMYDQLVSLNQQTVSFNANLAIEKLRLNEIGLKGSALDLQKQKDLTSELAIRTDELTASLQRENAIRTRLQGTARTAEVMNPRTRTAQSMTIIDQPAKDEAARLNKELQEARNNTQRLIGEIEKLKEVSIPGEGKKTQVDLEAEHAEEMERARVSGEHYAVAMKRLSDEKERAATITRKLAEEESDFASREGVRDSKGDLKDLEERFNAEEQFRQDRLSNERQAAIARIEIDQDNVKEEARLGKIGADEQARRLNALEEQKLEIEKAYLQKRIDTILARLNSDDEKTYAEDVKEWSKLLTDKQKAEELYLKNRQKNINAAATNEQKVWEKVGQGITRIFDQAVQGIVMGTERFGTAFAPMIDGILAKFIEGMLQMVAQWALTHILMVSIKESAHQKEVLMDAKAAAAGAWKAVVGIPIIGPILAPIAAATAFAGVEAFSAEGGMVVPADDTLSLLHANEMVLPANISAGLKDLIGNGGGAGGAHVTVNYNGDFSAIDSKGMQAVLAENSKHIAQLMRKELRRSNAV